MASNCPEGKPVPDIASLNWTIEGLADPCKRKSPIFVSPKKMMFRLILNIEKNKVNISLKCITACVWREEMRVKLSIVIYNETRAVFADSRVFEYKRRDNGKHDDFDSFDFCQPNTSNDKLTISCSAKIIAGFSLVKAELLMDLSANFGSLLFNGTLSDMTLSAGGKDFSVHKLVLAARSPVFGAMFENKDCKEVQEGRITIEDMSSDVCEEMLRHIYTGSIPYGMNEYAFDLFVAADKYQLTQLKSVCESALLSLLDVNSVCTDLLLADGCNAVNLKSECIQFIINNCNEVLQIESWKEVSAKNALLVELFHKAAIKSSRQM